MRTVACTGGAKWGTKIATYPATEPSSRKWTYGGGGMIFDHKQIPDAVLVGMVMMRHHVVGCRLTTN